MSRIGRAAKDDGGAAAVEFAFILPILVLLVGGIIDFGFMFNAQVSLTHAAREGVRVEAIGTGDPETAARDAFMAPAVDPASVSVTVTECPSVDGARLDITGSYDFFFLPFGASTLTGEAVMRCNG